jgi:hypothetical protein
MKPLKSGRPLSQWILRIALITILVILYFNVAKAMNFRNTACLLGILSILCGGLVFLGGVFSLSWMTILSAVVITGLSLYKIALSFNGSVDHALMIHLVPLALGFHFVCFGNDK